MAFTKPQQEAIEHDGHLLIVAGPGSGKTTTSVRKAQRILSDPQRKLLMVTFTKEGADEMRRRLTAALEKDGLPPPGDRKLLIGTFHSIALKHLYAHRPREKLLSPAQQNAFLQDAISQFSSDMEHGKALREEFEYFMYSIDQASVELTPSARSVIDLYTDRLKSSRTTDLYSVMRACSLQASDGSIPCMPYTDMIVDEGQDTDDLQRAWIFAHAAAGVNTTIVGDDDQSIYEWRHALGYSGMRSFLDTFQAKRIELGDNFRSRKEILAHAVVLVKHNQNRLDKNLVAARGPGGRITAYYAPGNKTQSKELAQIIADLPEQHKNTAVLARKNQSLDTLEFALSANEVPYVRLGKSIWDNPHVSNYLCLLQSLLDGSPVGIFSTLGVLDLDGTVRSELLNAMGPSGDDFLAGEVPSLNSATPTDVKTIKEFAKSCKFWRTQLGAGSVTEVVLDVGEWLASHQRKERVRDIVLMASEIVGRLNGKLSARLYFVNTNKKGAAQAPVTLMTMHASKGLEFETVHVIDANEPDDGSSLVHAEAERRLMYVALTRAKNRCVVWYNDEAHFTIAEAQLPSIQQFEKLKDYIAN